MRPIFQTFYMRIVLTDITHLRKEELFGSDQFDGIHLRGPVGADVYTTLIWCMILFKKVLKSTIQSLRWQNSFRNQIRGTRVSLF